MDGTLLGVEGELGNTDMYTLKGHAVPPCVVLVIDDILYGLMVALSYI